MMEAKMKQKLLAKLLCLREKIDKPEWLEDEYSNNGICSYLSDIEVYHIILTGYFNWPENSGHPMFPIFVGYKHNAKQEYITATSEQKWSPDHPYGAARRRLLDHLIKELSK